VTRRSLAGCLIGAALLAAGCIPRVPVVTTPAYPDFLFPSVPAAYESSRFGAAHRAAWAFLQTGDLDGAEQRFAVLLARDAEFFPAAAGLGWVHVAQGRATEALARFEVALERAEGYVPAIVGRGEALLATGAASAALASFETALAADPGLEGVERRVVGLRLRVVGERLAAARAAAEQGRLDEAEAAYAEAIAASPDSAFLYLELARVKQRRDDLPGALEEARRAGRLDPGDAAAALLEGDLLEALGDLPAAEEAYRRAEGIEPSDETADRLARVRAALRLEALPPGHRDIAAKAQVTRGDLAALLAVGLQSLLEDAAAGQPTPIFTDTRDHWANQRIVAVAQAGVMGVDGGHRFEPERQVRRGDLADVVGDVLDLIAGIDPEGERRWSGVRRRFQDMSQGHLSYESAARAVAAGVLSTADSDRFEPTRPVSGAEALDAVERLARLAGEFG
jgi:tetratricopeptide (TPR) repeat protein